MAEGPWGCRRTAIPLDHTWAQHACHSPSLLTFFFSWLGRGGGRNRPNCGREIVMSQGGHAVMSKLWNLRARVVARAAGLGAASAAGALGTRARQACSSLQLIPAGIRACLSRCSSMGNAHRWAMGNALPGTLGPQTAAPTLFEGPRLASACRSSRCRPRTPGSRAGRSAGCVARLSHGAGWWLGFGAVLLGKGGSGCDADVTCMPLASSAAAPNRHGLQSAATKASPVGVYPG